MKTSVPLVLLTRVLNVSTLTARPQDNNNRIRTGNPVCLLGNNLEGMVKDLTGARLLLSPSDLPRHRSSINDNYCAQVVTGRVSPVSVTGQKDFCVQSVVSVTGQDYYVTNNLETRTQLPVYYPVVSHVPFAGGSPQKKGVIPDHERVIKSVKGVNQLSSAPNVTNVPLVVPNPPVG